MRIYSTLDIIKNKAKEQILRNSPPSDYNIHYDVLTLESGEKALKRVVTPKEKYD